MVAAFRTFWPMLSVVPATKSASPPYVAVIRWLPTESAEVTSVAAPPLNVAVPSVTIPSRKVTAPVGVPVPGASAVTAAARLPPGRTPTARAEP